MPRALVFALPLALLATAIGCAATYGRTPTAAAAAPKPAVDKPLDLSDLGHPVDLGEIVEIKGYNTVWLRGTHLLVTLLKTAWDETDGDRVGRATLKLERRDESKIRTIEEGDEKRLLGFKVKVSMAYETYREDGRWVPHAKFTVRR